MSSSSAMSASPSSGWGASGDRPGGQHLRPARPAEIGRAGRDGQPAEGITLYGSADMAWALRRTAGREVSEEVRQVQNRKLRQLYGMLDGVSCRAAAVRRYFGEEGVEACGVCDLCLAPPESIDATVPAQKALAAVHRL
eukprot:gene55202-75639_t